MANYLTFASDEPFTIAVGNATKNWDGILEYSTDTVAWNEWDGTMAIESAEHGGEQKIYMRGSGNGEISEASTTYTSRFWVLTGINIRCDGNIETLLDYVTVQNGEHPTMKYRCFFALFYNCTSLIQAPDLPATTLQTGCYENMFYGCTGLTAPPELPATTLATSCYESMFQECTGLITAPALPATTLAERCYYRMFSDCDSLASIPSLPATELPKECYARMFIRCTGLKLSTAQSEEYPNEYRLPASADGTTVGVIPMAFMFDGTGGEEIGSSGTPEINTTYYTANKVIPATKPVAPKLDPTALLMGWQVGNRIASMKK